MGDDTNRKLENESRKVQEPEPFGFNPMTLIVQHNVLNDDRTGYHSQDTQNIVVTWI